MILFFGRFTVAADVGPLIGLPVVGSHLLSVLGISVFMLFWRAPANIRLGIIFLAFISVFLTFVLLPNEDDLWKWSLPSLAAAGGIPPILVAFSASWLFRRFPEKF
ncbi:MAG: hypothetical protein ABIQ35_03920 [Verrucomicrobiota bacterium]